MDYGGKQCYCMLIKKAAASLTLRLQSLDCRRVVGEQWGREDLLRGSLPALTPYNVSNCQGV